MRWDRWATAASWSTAARDAVALDRPRPVRALGLAAATVLSAAGSACGGDADTVEVSAAASLADVFEQIATSFEDAEDGPGVRLNVGASSALALQIEEGSRVDVFASANLEVMTSLAERIDDLGTPHVFATSDLVIAVPAGSAGPVRGVEDFGDESLLLGACAPQVPCGAYARRVFVAAGIDPALDTEEPDVRALAGRIAAGELDAGLVYRTDVVAADGALRAIDLPPDVAVRAEYVVATVGEPSPAATAFVDFLLAGDGRTILADAGFGVP